MDRLRQALAGLDHKFHANTVLVPGEEYYAIRDAARLVLEGEPILWCEEHKMPRCGHAFAGGHCVGQHPLDGPEVGSCRMVERLLTEVPE